MEFVIVLLVLRFFWIWFNILVTRRYCHVVEWLWTEFGLVIRIYWILKRIRYYNLQLALTHRLMFSFTVFTALLVSGLPTADFPLPLGLRTVPGLSYRKSLSACRLSRALELSSPLIMAAGPRYIASTRTPQKHLCYRYKERKRKRKKKWGR
jgi:hypothetical protein